MLKILSILLLLVGLKHVTCLHKKSTCEPAWDAPVDGSIRCTDGNSVGSVCRFDCDEGYIMVGIGFTGCFISNTGVKWTSNAPRCENPICEPAWDAPVAGSIFCSMGSSFGSYCRFACDEGYKMVGSRYTSCHYSYIERKYKWSSDAPRCVLEKSTCEPAWDAPADGSVTCTDGNYVGSFCEFSCDEGYQMEGEDRSRCHISNTGVKWTSDAPRCVLEKSTCESAWDAPADGSVTCTDGNYVGSVCRFSCDEGYHMEGEDRSRCHISNTEVKWTSDAPRCEKLTCESAWDAPVDGSVTCTDGNNYESVCRFTCDIGYIMIGSSYSRCVISYTGTGVIWTSDAPRCENSTCEPVWDAPVDGSVTCTDGNYGIVCEFSCDEGYIMVGIGYTGCFIGSTGAKWTSNAPRCEKSTCEPAWDAPVDGSIRCTDGNNYGSYCRFTCDEGYKMDGSLFTSCHYSYIERKYKWSSDAPRCGITYKLEKTSGKGNFQECQEMCAQAGGTLAQHSLALAYKDKMMAITGGVPTWIGVNNDNSQNEWRYTTIDGGHKPFPTTNSTSIVGKWAKGEPGTDHQLCATIYKPDHDLVFTTLTCDPATSKQLYGICEHP